MTTVIFNDVSAIYETSNIFSEYVHLQILFFQQ